MNAFAYAPEWVIMAVGAFTVLVMLGAVCNVVGAMYMRLGKANIVYTAAIAVITYMFFSGISDRIESLTNHTRMVFLAEAIGYVPSIVVLVIPSILASANCVILYILIRRKRNALTANTIKCTVDGMDDGICFFDGKGKTLLVNVQMNKISSELFGMEIMNGRLFWSNILTGNYKSGTLLKKEPTVVIETVDHRVWNVRLAEQILHHAPIYSVTAYDISEQICLYREIEKRNAILNNVNIRLKEYNKAIKQVVADKETLAVKVRVHDDLGRVLLAARNILSGAESAEDRKALLSMWDNAVAVMKNEAKPTEQSDAVALLLQAAKSVQVKIETEGKFPEAPTAKKLLIAAAHECLTNTVKHARGDRLYIKITEHDDYMEAQYLNNGTPPAEPIKESGGLSNLRKAIEKSGGTMTIDIEPRFTLTVSVPKGEDNIWKKQKS